METQNFFFGKKMNEQIFSILTIGLEGETRGLTDTKLKVGIVGDKALMTLSGIYLN